VISVNLLPIEERPKESGFSAPPRLKVLLPFLLVAAVAFPLAGVFVVQQAKVQGLREDISQAEAERARLAPQIKAVEELTQRQAELRQRLRTLRDLVRRRGTAVQVVDELARQVPANLWLTKFEARAPGSYELEGSTFSNLVVAELMGRLEGSDLFYGVDLTETKRALIGSEPVIDFAITFKSGSTPQSLGEMELNAQLRNNGTEPGGS
jgi:type IV pilus assembly protein PilN